MFYFICYILAYQNLYKRDLVVKSIVNCILNYPIVTSENGLRKKAEICSCNYICHLYLYFIKYKVALDC